MTTTLDEAKRRYDTLTRRIEAIDTDIGRTIDSELKFGLEQRRATLMSERDAVMSEMPANDKRGNGDMEMLQRKVSELAKVLASDHPAEAHAIINECIGALSRLDVRVRGLEGRVNAIERHIDPPLAVSLWRAAAVIIVLFGGSLFWVKEAREVLFGLLPWAGLIVEGSLVIATILCVLMANVKLEEHSR